MKKLRTDQNNIPLCICSVYGGASLKKGAPRIVGQESLLSLCLLALLGFIGDKHANKVGIMYFTVWCCYKALDYNTLWDENKQNVATTTTWRRKETQCELVGKATNKFKGYL